MTADVAIAGLGAMGSAAAYMLAARGRRVLGFDRFAPPHALGSSHGGTRIIREAYFEHPLYVPLVRRAYELWSDLERRSGRTLFRQTGGVNVGPRGGVLVEGARVSAAQHGIAHETLSAGEIRRRFPILSPTDEMVAVYETRAGVLFPELCIGAFLDVARGCGADIRIDEPVLEWTASGDGVEIRTTKGEYRARRLMISAGAWTTRMLGDVDTPLTVTRQPVHWFEPAEAGDDCSLAKSPVTLWEFAPDRIFYTLPDAGSGVKVAIHYEGEPTDADGVRREVGLEEVEAAKALLATYMPPAAGRHLASSVCLYTNTPDLHFLIDVHPVHSQVLVVSACSGHGFKFASVVGEIAADLLDTGTSAFDLAPFRFRRVGMH